MKAAPKKVLRGSARRRQYILSLLGVILEGSDALPKAHCSTGYR